MSSPMSLSKLLAGHFTHSSRWLEPVFLIYFKPVFLMAENRSSEPGGDVDVDIGAAAGGTVWQP